MESLLHSPAEQSVVDREQSHTLVMCHETANQFRRAAASRIIEGLEKSITTRAAEGAQLQEIRGRLSRLQHQREHAGIRSHNIARRPVRTGAQRCDAKCPILVLQQVISSRVCRFGNAPRNVLLSGVCALNSNCSSKRLM